MQTESFEQISLADSECHKLVLVKLSGRGSVLFFGEKNQLNKFSIGESLVSLTSLVLIHGRLGDQLCMGWPQKGEYGVRRNVEG
ncbi:hypothetical protein HanXRQr2_Chr16g0725231 [Helianthus annuus]|uniref:Uncharacterized protein n=1 Tax=Helianthus annuus TaxID=4232 RepID=A0A9K3DPZ6_HELAN|nr:hypothetical protein HanXRQr2_Chr16g0725231 [Helianthus annuus]